MAKVLDWWGFEAEKPACCDDWDHGLSHHQPHTHRMVYPNKLGHGH